MIQHTLNIWWYYVKLCYKGIYLWVTFRTLQVYYMIFTPKHAEYIEDIPKLYDSYQRLELWRIMAVSAVVMRGIIEK